jgi:hypothetical protein
MKTQLLEDIGENTTLSFAPSNIVGDSKANKEVHKTAPPQNAQPAKSRSALGVWRQKPAEAPLLFPADQPDHQPTPVELSTVFEEIAALEAQFVPPGRPHEPAVTAVEPLHELPPTPVEPPTRPVVPPADVTLARNTTQRAAPAPDPLFDFTPSPAPQAADPFTPAPTGLTRSRQRYLLLAMGVLSVVLLILGGRWFYQERDDAGALALVADQAKEQPQVDKAREQPALVAKEPTPEPGRGARPTPAVPASEPVPTPPPLVMLEREPAAEPEAVAEREPTVEREPAAAPLPKPSSTRRAREQSGAAVGPARNRSEREPVRQVARASSVGAEKPSTPDTSMDATLKACRERGYDAAQCVKRACSMTRYGFVCRGR